jgi:hypothetical protein
MVVELGEGGILLDELGVRDALVVDCEAAKQNGYR